MNKIRPVRDIFKHSFLSDESGERYATQDFKVAFNDIVRDLAAGVDIVNYLLDCPTSLAALVTYGDVDCFIYHALNAKDNYLNTMEKPAFAEGDFIDNQLNLPFA